MENRASSSPGLVSQKHFLLSTATRGAQWCVEDEQKESRDHSWGSGPKVLKLEARNAESRSPNITAPGKAVPRSHLGAEASAGAARLARILRT